ncbi:hypothetical protein HG267_40615 (plasmid) [Tolypothrix sp. PCC 7601]|uniref:hypothetical protein n=1 Tax=Tolypothrix sp. PCC 7712 TaxID=2596898 RepID=UPI000AEC7BF6|nr:hypothetical protein [Tolypothrix sp. PCC 7712]UYD38799.1 hypothetical protein HG267_40615 [Tolypothrix sp. PCC 7601]
MVCKLVRGDRRCCVGKLAKHDIQPQAAGNDRPLLLDWVKLHMTSTRSHLSQRV